MERARPFGAGIPVSVVDALIIRVRKGGRVRLSSVLLATGTDREGYREVLGLLTGGPEAESTWSE
ncbi:MAG: transposase [Armatimonadota bacterium]|nr:transposase [Armatimonadota bacterium]